eukprot:1138813-Pelagomonas_calceolata.AAC.1
MTYTHTPYGKHSLKNKSDLCNVSVTCVLGVVQKGAVRVPRKVGGRNLIQECKCALVQPARNACARTHTRTSPPAHLVIWNAHTHALAGFCTGFEKIHALPRQQFTCRQDDGVWTWGKEMSRKCTSG